MDFIKKILLLYSCLSIANVFNNSIVQALKAEQIVGGRIVPPQKYTFNAFVKVSPHGICSGVIIGKKTVITASHCLYDSSGKLRSRQVTVIAGTTDVTDTSENRVDIDVAKIYILKDFIHEIKYLYQSKDTEFKDIAVLKLTKSLDIKNNPYISKIELPANDVNYDGKRVVAFGFGVKGMDFHNSEPMPLFDGKLRYIRAMVSKGSHCLKFFLKLTIKNSEQFMCAEMEQESHIIKGSTCKGDSGGPLVYNENTLIGIISLGPPFCNVAQTMFIKISSFRTFINKAKLDKPDKTMHCESLSNESLCSIM
ncbi:chymotrypsin-2-like [Copidosoma floridanum]|uniref:chymotrypsin-2-like n=1 Tax=Copidosoma floridanum TaxID=29053 RepID=UPI0006C98153|nr:chymotrypsin-2-like [Copidosoma floridanum]